MKCIKYISFVSLLIGIGCTQIAEYKHIMAYKYTFGGHEGTIVLSGMSVLDSGMFFLRDNLSDTTIESYKIINDDLYIGISKDFNTELFAIYPNLDSGYLFGDQRIIFHKL